MLSGQFKPNKTKFYILSSDRDFEHIARLLQKKSFKVKQVTKEQYIMHKNIDNGLMPKLTEFKKNIYLHDIKHLCDIWTKENNNRPAKIKTLKKDIYQKLKLTDESVDRIFELLQEYKIVHVNHTKIGYNQGHIKNWSALDTGDYQPDKMTLKLRKKELALPPKVEYILGDMSLKRLKIICDLLFLLKKKPATINEFSEWLKEELMIEHVFSMQNIINTIQSYCVIEKRNHQIIFDDEVIENWARININRVNDNFIRMGNTLLVKDGVMRLKDKLARFVTLGQKIGEQVDDTEYLDIAKSVFPNEDDKILMQLAICQGWVIMKDDGVVYSGLALKRPSIL